MYLDCQYRFSIGIPKDSDKYSVGTRGPYRNLSKTLFNVVFGLRHIARICGQRANCWQLLAMLRDSSHVAGSHVRESRKVGRWLAARCGLPAFLVYTHTQNPGTCIRDLPRYRV